MANVLGSHLCNTHLPGCFSTAHADTHTYVAPTLLTEGRARGFC